MAPNEFDHPLQAHQNEYSSNQSKDGSTVAQLFDFFAHAQDSTIISILVLISAVTFLVFGRLGILIIGIAAGIFLHATWTQQDDGAGNRYLERRRKENTYEIMRRLLDWHEDRQSSEKPNTGVQAEIALRLASQKSVDFSDFPPNVSSALEHLVDAAIRDYVEYWYSPILPTETEFIDSSRQTLTGFILAFGTHQTRKRPADVFLAFLTNATSIFIVFLTELSNALQSKDGLELEVHEAIQLYVDRSSDSSLANMIDPKEQEKRFLATADDMLSAFLDYKMFNCGPMRIFLRHILAEVIFKSILKTISQPEWINGWLVYLLEDGEPEILNAIDAGVEIVANKSEATSTGSKLVVPMNAEETKVSTEQVTTDKYKQLSFVVEHTQNKISSGTMEAETMIDSTNKEMVPDPDLSHLVSTVPTGQSGAMHRSTDSVKLNNDDGVQSELRDAEGREQYNKVSDSRSDEPFTSFDQIVPTFNALPEATQSLPPLTLHNGKITVIDDSQIGDKLILKNKPQIEYLLQIEPANSAHSGWMVARSFNELEPLHEYLYKIANVSGAPGFTRRYQYLPSYKGKTKSDLRLSLEKYFCDVLTYETLAESEGVKRFLDKDQGFRKSGGNNKSALKFPAPVGEAFQTVGKGMLGSLNTATKGMAAGGQAVFEGVGGLFTGPKKAPVTMRVTEGTNDVNASNGLGRKNTSDESPDKTSKLTNPEFISDTPSSARKEHDLKELTEADENKNLEPEASSRWMKPALIKDDTHTTDTTQAVTAYANHDEPVDLESQAGSNDRIDNDLSHNSTPMRHDPPGQQKQSHSVERSAKTSVEVAGAVHASEQFGSRSYRPFDEQETRVALELIFAAINELFTLSNVWNFRRTLLNAARSYISRPGNPSLISIQKLLQSSIESNITSEAIAEYIQKLRENSLPTEKELATWPAPMEDEEKKALESKARKLLVNRGMPQALASVMGAAASGEALGKVFDALQIEKVAAGLMSALLVQATRSAVN